MHLALAASLGSLACATVTRALGSTATPQPPPTSTPSPLSASEELQHAVPSSLADVISLSISGDELDASDPAVAALLAGVDPSEVEVAARVASGEGGIVFQAGAVRIPGRDWSASLDALAASTGTWDRISLGSHDVLRGQDVSDPTALPIYYLTSGNTLYYVRSSDADAAEETIGNLPGGSTSGGGSSSLPPPGSSPLVIVVMQQPTPPVCVAEPAGRPHLMMMALDTGLGGVPSPFAMFTVSGQAMAVLTAPLVGPLADVPYAAARYAGGREQLMIEAHGLMGGIGVLPLAFDIRHCLEGTWQDGDRVLRLSPPGSDSFIAEVQSGTICEEEGGIAFSGSLAGDRVSGSDLKTCSPQRCVDAGFLEKVQLLEFTGAVADDGLSLAIDWTGPFYQWEEDSQGNLTSCDQTSTEDNSFTITRLTFGD